MSGHSPNPADSIYYNYTTTTHATEVMPEVSTLYQMVMELGIPACVIIAAFWFIRYQSELAEER
jgi:hypothetical protein